MTTTARTLKLPYANIPDAIWWFEKGTPEQHDRLRQGFQLGLLSLEFTIETFCDAAAFNGIPGSVSQQFRHHEFRCYLAARMGMM